MSEYSFFTLERIFKFSLLLLLIYNLFLMHQLYGSYDKFDVSLIYKRIANNNRSMSAPTQERNMRANRTEYFRILNDTKRPTILKRPTKLNVLPSKRPRSCSFCFLHKFNYLIENKHICENNDGKQEIDVIIMIFTTHSSRKKRDAIRQTWLVHSRNNTANVRYAFLLGYTQNKKMHEDILNENILHKDFVQEDFFDSYLNLTYKTMMAMKWASTNCKTAQFIMKTDDDMYVNIPGLLKIVLRNKKKLQHSIGGACSLQAYPIRSVFSKWYASEQSYPEKTYPGFCSGTGYVTSMAVAVKIFDISKHIPFFHLEDVYMALCAKKLQINLFPLAGFHSVFRKLPICTYKNLSIITIHEVPPHTLYKIWKAKC